MQILVSCIHVLPNNTEFIWYAVMFVPWSTFIPFRVHELFVGVGRVGVEEQTFDIVGLFVVHLASEYVLLSEPLHVTALD